MKSAGINHIIVKVDEIYNDKTNIGGIDFIKDTSYHPEQHVKGVGKCIAVPNGEGQGDPHMYIAQEVNVGDEVLFHYNVIDPSNELSKNTYLCDYQHVFAVRDGDGWKMIGGWVMMKPAYETGVKKVDVDGHEMAVRTTESGIITETNIKPSTKFAELMYTGTPTKDRGELPFRSGDVVLYIKDMDFEVDVDGETVFLMRQEELLGKVSVELEALES